jgi:hypothetical protein
MQEFWREQTQISETRDGFTLTLPLMYPDGWQVTVLLQLISPGHVRCSDQGSTIGPLVEAGMNLDAKHTRSLLNERIETFELDRDGFVLSKNFRLPLEGVDVQLFAEALVSIAHLIYRNEPSEIAVETPADRTVKRVFRERHLTPIEGALLPGRVEKKIRVDYYLEAKRPFALEVIRRREPTLNYIEQWAWRWTDLRNRDRRLLNAMVYDPDLQRMDQPVLDIGRSVCDLFCPYFETEQLDRLIQNSQ